MLVLTIALVELYRDLIIAATSEFQLLLDVVVRREGRSSILTATVRMQQDPKVTRRRTKWEDEVRQTQCRREEGACRLV
jgi:hypothetical protein